MTYRTVDRMGLRLEEVIQTQDRRIFDLERRIRSLTGGGGDGGGGEGVVTGISVAGSNSAVIGTGVTSMIPLDGTVHWSDGSFTTTGSAVRCVRPGRYLVIAQVGWAIAGSEEGTRAGVEVYLYASPTVPRMYHHVSVSSSGSSPAVQVNGILNLEMNATLYLMCVQNTGEDRTPTNNWLQAQAVGAGEPGPPGPTSVIRTYEVSFASPLTEWVVNHNFGSTAVEVNAFDPTGLIQYDPEIEITSINTVTVRWFYPTTGIVRVLG